MTAANNAASSGSSRMAGMASGVMMIATGKGGSNSKCNLQEHPIPPATTIKASE
ncbi:hypothetical protein [Pannonibacter sp. SL95]|uniref:hypothetical protein n=1 Tax=Pannonibacter sp. SL95 TaxID=2995153 RepID=UPI0022726F30|nr:hypothetical protein [Pannonibacter sp. SL95]MCY1705850.1 hypothetical protein [Pannonibacter sp. SL95]